MIDNHRNVAPRYVPGSYELVATSHDEHAVSGFATLSPQVTFTYAARGSGKGSADTIEVHHTPEADQELVAAAGQQRAFKLGHCNAVYHDAVNTAVGADSAGNAIIKWDHTRHSITVSSTSGTYAVRAPSSVPYGELVRIASSLPL